MSEDIPFVAPLLGRAFMLLVEPDQRSIDDPFEPGNVALPIWLVDSAMGGWTKKPLVHVWNRLSESAPSWGTSPDVALVVALWYPQSPYGVMWQQKDKDRSLVAWRGMLWTRNGRGALTPTGVEMPRSSWPPAKVMTARINRQVEQWRAEP